MDEDQINFVMAEQIPGIKERQEPEMNDYQKKRLTIEEFTHIERALSKPSEIIRLLLSKERQAQERPLKFHNTFMKQVLLRVR